MQMLKKLFLRFFAQPTSMWLEQILDNPGMKKDYREDEVLFFLKKASFTESDLNTLIVDLQHSASHVKYNSKTDSGKSYDKEVYNRYIDLALIVLKFKEKEY